MSQIYNENTKTPKAKGDLRNLIQGIYTFCWKFNRGPWAQESAAETTYLSLRICTKSCYIFPLKVATTLLSGSGKGAVGAQ